MVTPNAVKKLRDVKGWTTYDLANEIGCNQSTISRIEAGGRIGRVIGKSLERLIASATSEERAA